VCLLWVGLLEVAGEGVELRLPEPAVLLDPARGEFHGPGHQAAAADATLFRMRHQPRPLEHAEMFVDAGEGHAEWTRQIRERRVARGQSGEDRPARGVGERGERDVEGEIVRLNHMVKFTEGPSRVKPPRLPPRAP